MSKINKRVQFKKFAKIIKLLARCWLIALKLTLAFMLRVFNLAFKGISKRLRFSITFKTASMYTIIFSIIILIFSVSMIASFSVYLLNEAKSSLERNAQVASELVRENLVPATGENRVTLPEAKLKRYAEIEGIQIVLLNRQKKVLYTTSPDNLPETALNNPYGVFVTGG